MITFFSILVTVIVTIVTYTKWKYLYWKKKNIPYLEPSLLVGNISNPLLASEPIAMQLKRLYGEIKSRNWKNAGIFTLSRPCYLLTDLEHVKNILLKDFQYFDERGLYYDEKNDPTSAHLASLNGARWKKLKLKLSPTFTASKMRIMFETLRECENKLCKKIDDVLEESSLIDAKEIFHCHSINVIGSCAFGLDCNAFQDNNSDFVYYSRKMIGCGVIRQIGEMFVLQYPRLARLLGIRQIYKDITDYFAQVIKDTTKYREDGNIYRRDFLQLLIELKNHENPDERLTIEEVVAQSYIFFIGGFRTIATTMALALLELARNEQVQNRAREEIESVLAKHDGQVSYDALKEMKYVKQILDETLRMYPSIPMTMRKCVSDYTSPDQTFSIEKGIYVIVPILAIHYDPEYYPDPDKFDPDRFSDENLRTIPQYAHIPFGEGPRICFGKRFGSMTSKMALVSMLRKYKFTAPAKTGPVRFQSNAFDLSPSGNVWLHVQKL